MTPNRERRIAEKSPYSKKTCVIHGKKMAYVDEGTGDPVVFLHGNPTSSFLWRNIMPSVQGSARVIAPDLIGMGDSEKLTDSSVGSYGFAQHRLYLFALLKALGVTDNVTLVLHDWGSGLGFHWAEQNRSAVKGIAYMEAIVAPMPDWNSFPEAARALFQAFRSNAGEVLILEKNLFVERVLPKSILRALSESEIEEYRRPFAQSGEGRRPTLSWPRELPIAGEPANVVRLVSEYAAWLSQCEIPKLFVNAEPGAILHGAARAFARSWPNQTEVTVSGAHFLQEDSPHEIGEALAAWYQGLGRHTEDTRGCPV